MRPLLPGQGAYYWGYVVPNRMIREGMIESISINSLSCEAERFYTRLLLKADDFGCFTGHRLLLRAALYPLKPEITEAIIDKCVRQCVSVDLVREYSDESGKKYLYIPKFNQRLRAMHRKFPEPPPSVVSGVQTDDGQVRKRESLSQMSDTCPPEVEVEVEVEVEDEEYSPNGELLKDKPSTTNGSGKKSFLDQAKDVLDFLNWKLSRSWKARTPKGQPTANANIIVARLKEGYTPEECKLIASLKITQWFDDDKMRNFIRPSTLYRPSHFSEYLGETERLPEDELRRIRIENGFIPQIINGGSTSAH